MALMAPTHARYPQRMIRGESDTDVVMVGGINTVQYPLMSVQAALSGNIGHGLQLVCPLTIHIEADDDGSFVVSDDVFLVYGNGKTIGQALADYTKSICDYYGVLEAEARTNPAGVQQFGRLKTHLIPAGE